MRPGSNHRDGPTMAQIFAPDMWWLWARALGTALFIPVRNLILTLALRRHARRTGEAGAEVQQPLRRRTNVTAALLCYVFAVIYTNHLFAGS